MEGVSVRVCVGGGGCECVGGGGTVNVTRKESSGEH